MGPYQGGQAEFVLVPSADFNYLKLGVWRSFEGCCGSLCGRQCSRTGAIPVDFSQGDPVERISKFVKNIMEFSRAVVQAKKSCGVWTGAIDAVGYQARDDKNPSRENPTQALENALRVVNPTGSVGVIGVYIAPDSGAKDEQPTGDLLVPSS